MHRGFWHSMPNLATCKVMQMLSTSGSTITEICFTTFAPGFRSLQPSAHSLDMPTNLAPQRPSSCADDDRLAGLSSFVEAFSLRGSRDGQMQGRG
jgi:hypothetical protein